MYVVILCDIPSAVSIKNWEKSVGLLNKDNFWSYLNSQNFQRVASKVIVDM